MGGVGAKRRLQNPIHGAPTSASETMVFQTTQSARKKGSSGEGAGSLEEKTCHRASTTRHTRLLQPHLSCSQGRGGGKMEANHRFVKLKRLHRGSKFKDGNHGGNPGFHSTGRLVHIPGSRGCVLAHSIAQNEQKVLKICIPKSGMAISDTGVWPLKCSMAVHPAHESSKDHGQEPGVTYTSVPGRLAIKEPRSTGFDPTNSMDAKTMCHTRIKSKPEKVRDCAQARLQFCGLQVPYHQPQGLSNKGENRKNKTKNFHLFGNRPKQGKDMAVIDGTPECHREISASGETPFKRDSVLSSQSVESGRQRSPCKGSPVRVSKACSPVVVFPTQFRKGFSDSSTQTTPHGVFGCLNRGLGRSYPGSRGVRVVDESTNTVPHQFFGNDGGSQCLNTLEGHICEQCSFSGHRQFHSGGISEQARGHSFQKLVPLGKTPIALGSQIQHHSPSKTHSRSTECNCRWTVKEKSNSGNRMVTLSTNFQGALPSDGRALDRSVCHQTQQQDKLFHIPSTRPTGLGSGCTSHIVGGNVGLCLSSNISPSSSTLKDTNRELSGAPSSTSLPTGFMVSNTVGSVGRDTSEVTGGASSAPTASVKDIPSEAGDPVSSRLAVIKRSITAKGFSSDTAECISVPVRKSTSTVYDSKWRIFCSWCEQRKANPLKATVQQIAEFLLEKKKGGLRPSTLEGYRSAIAGTLKFSSSLDISNDIYISALLKNFRQSSLRERNTVPPWSLSLVLASLRQAPFEPLKAASIDILTWKTAFLIALASGKRRSEIHAIERSSISWTETRDRVTLRVDPSFVAKTQIAENVRAVQPIRIDSLRGFIDDSPEDLLLCPVRALFLYFLVKSKKKLFVSYKVGRDKEISKVTISNWIKKAIVKAYRLWLWIHVHGPVITPLHHFIFRTFLRK